VISERDRIGACGQDPRGQLRREAGAVGRVFGVDDAKAGTEFLA
jgi:hypothetical protein